MVDSEKRPMGPGQAGKVTLLDAQSYPLSASPLHWGWAKAGVWTDPFPQIPTC
jgi:hypothetical protein